MKNEIRKPHASGDLESRYRKGLKIERLIGLSQLQQPIRLLEIGTGSGGLSHYFGTHPQLDCIVHSVDVNDVRAITDGYNFNKINGTQLPFSDGSFDVVISNHVIEHVGDKVDQDAHLKEIYRVLAGDGIGYLAVPNRWMLVEPHYKLIFLSWFPDNLRTPYLKLMKKGHFYDCKPLNMKELEGMLINARLIGKNLCIQAIREIYNTERKLSVINKILSYVPDVVFVFLRPIIPTLIYSLKKSTDS
jgi:ubiquinone/menaquinone biosynthesis C-methylase UbiE